MQNRNSENEGRRYNCSYPKVAVQCSANTFVVAESSVLLTNFCGILTVFCSAITRPFHQAPKRWRHTIMRRFLIPTIFTLIFYACSDSPQHDKTVSQDISKIIYADSGQTKFIITAGDSNTRYDFKTIETKYKVVFIDLKNNYNYKDYFAKYTTTSEFCRGCEGQKRTIKVELRSFDNPQKSALTIQKDCDDLTLNIPTYSTVKYGCCGEENQLAIYDYENKLIIEGNSKILLGQIPNSNLNLYVAYKPQFYDTAFIGILYFCYNSSDRYVIKIKSNPLLWDSCNLFSHDILIHTTSKKDIFQSVENEYTFWSLNEIKNKSQINNLTLKVAYWCGAEPILDTLVIPIINGKPFGNDERNQVINFRPNLKRSFF
ncbi:MAG: hypothetical protein ORN85_07805 [Sediminibacterium sp.]|nr:hypothetical protein [Sediminibacterium sp.]